MESDMTKIIPINKLNLNKCSGLFKQGKHS